MNNPQNKKENQQINNIMSGLVPLQNLQVNRRNNIWWHDPNTPKCKLKQLKKCAMVNHNTVVWGRKSHSLWTIWLQTNYIFSWFYPKVYINQWNLFCSVCVRFGITSPIFDAHHNHFPKPKPKPNKQKPNQMNLTVVEL